jgi:phosphatidate cytidylyltransferase
VSDRPYSTLATRLAVSFLAIPIIVWSAWVGGVAFFGFVALISSFSLVEYYKLMEHKGAAPIVPLGLVFGLLVNGAFIYERFQVEFYLFLERCGIRLAMFSQLQFLLVVLLLFVLVVLLVELFRTRGSPSLNIAATVSGVVFISLFFGTLIGLRELFPYGFPIHKFFPTSLSMEEHLPLIHQWGGYTMIALLATIWSCDTAAYVGGASLGKRKLFERVSPKKTWEGAAFGFVAAVATMVAAQAFLLDYLRLADAMVVGAIVGVFGQLGDLIESRFKRDAGVKDSSSIIPGHGGVYDRFDSLVFVSPIVYLYIDFVVLS